jgi:glutathione S-transferase
MIMGAHLDETKKAKLMEALKWFEEVLNKGTEFAASNDFTLADLSLCVTVSQIEAFDFDLYPFPLIRKWLKRCKEFLSAYGYEVSF